MGCHGDLITSDSKEIKRLKKKCFYFSVTKVSFFSWQKKKKDQNQTPPDATSARWRRAATADLCLEDPPFLFVAS